MNKEKLVEAITLLNKKAEELFDGSMTRIQEDPVRNITWVAEDLIKASYEKMIYSAMLKDLREHEADVVLEELKKNLNKSTRLERSSNHFCLLESVIQQETKTRILDNLNWVI